MADEKLVGLLVGRENTFPQAFIDRVNSKNMGVRAEFCRLGGTRIDTPVPYSCIVDRISHEIPYYRAYLKKAVLDGCVVINNPFWWAADDKFFEACLALKQGVAVPRTIVLPQKSYVEGVVSESLRNLQYPLDWKAIADYIGFPAFLKPFWGGGWKNVYKVTTLDELIWAFDQTGELGMILQEGIQFDKYARCMCIGQSRVQVIRYEPGNPFHMRYVVGDPAQFFGKELYERIAHDALLLMSALGYDMCTSEFAVRDGVPYAIDWLNPAPDMDYYSITPTYFEWAVENMADLAIQRALNGYTPGAEYRWDRFLNSTPPPLDSPLKSWAEFAHPEMRAAHAEQSSQFQPAPERGEGGVPEAHDLPSDGGPSVLRAAPGAEETP